MPRKSQPDREQAERLARQEKLKERLKDLLAEDPEGTAIALGDLALTTLASRYPEALTPEKKQKIRDNYSHATDALMQERSMNEEGLAMAAGLAIQSMRIAVDYSPLSHWIEDSRRDDALPRSAGEQVGRLVMQAFTSGETAGMSLFGVTATIILTATAVARQKKLAWPKLVRPLVDALELAVQGGVPPSKEQEEMMMQQVMAMMGISHAEAKRYLEEAKRQLR